MQLISEQLIVCVRSRNHPDTQRLLTLTQVLGIITALFALGLVGLHYLLSVRDLGSSRKSLNRGQTLANNLLPVLAVATTLTGFKDLSTVSLCITQSISIDVLVLLGLCLAGPLSLGFAISLLDMFLGRRFRWKTRGGSKAASSITDKENF